MRNVITAFFRLCLRIFFRRIEVLGLEGVPERAAVFAVNHPNGLLDPLFVLCFGPERVSFLAKAPLFRYPIIGWFVRMFEAIPVYRKQDNVAGSNDEMFATAHRLLQSGASIAVFPEGTTHDDPQLRDLKTGAARIALGAGVSELAVVPTGIYYTSKHQFRSSALVLYGEPIPVRPVTAEGEPPRAEVEELTAAIDAGLDAVTLQADSHAALELIARAEDIFTSSEEQRVAEEFDIRRRFIEGYHYLRSRDPHRLELLRSAIDQFDAELRRANLDVHELRPSVDPMRILRVLVLFPIAVAGAIVHYPAYRLVGALARHFSKGERNMVATMKFLAALALYPITYLAVVAVVAWYAGPAWAVAALLILPPLGWIALRTFEELDAVIGDARAIVHRMFRGYGHARLLEQRAAIRERILEIAKEIAE
jgi:glycerol-3-phosphate O-acyltransferase/dihydroxyacetone phosphate acyltransferase